MFRAFISTLLFVPIVLFCIIAFGQDVPVPPVDDGALFSELLKLFTLKGASTMAVVAAIVQFLLRFLNSSLFNQWFSKLDGHIKLLLVSFFTITGSIVSLMSGGMTFLSALTSGVVLTSVMVFVNQLIQQFSKKT